MTQTEGLRQRKCSECGKNEFLHRSFHPSLKREDQIQCLNCGNIEQIISKSTKTKLPKDWERGEEVPKCPDCDAPLPKNKRGCRYCGHKQYSKGGEK